MKATELKHQRIDQASDDSPSHGQYRKYFDEYLPGLVGQLLLSDLNNLSAHVEIVVKNSGDQPWRLTLENGVLVYVGQDGPDPECRYVLDVNTLVDVVSARVTPQDAFFEMRIEIEGDIERGLELSAVLEIFFEKFPYTIY